MKKILNLQKIILLIMFFVIEFFLAIAYFQFSKNDWIFINQSLFFGGKYSLQLYCFQF